MTVLIFIVFAIAFIAVQFSDRRVLRICFAIVTLFAMTVGAVLLTYTKSYGNSYVALAVCELANKAPIEQRERLIEASNEFKRDFRKESIFTFRASSQLWSQIKQINAQQQNEATNVTEEN